MLAHDGEPVNLQDHHLVLALLACVAVVGLAIGYCVEVLRSSSREAKLNASWDKEREQLNAAIERQKSTTQSLMTAEKRASVDSKQMSQEIRSKHDALAVHVEVQARKIANLEAELRAAEEQNVKLQSDFAGYKTNKTKELEVLRAYQRKHVSGSVTADDVNKPVVSKNSSTRDVSLPVLSKRVVSDRAVGGGAPVGERLASSLHAKVDVPRVSRKRAIAGSSGFTASILDADIPMLAESELSNSEGELDFAALLAGDEGVVTGG